MREHYLIPTMSFPSMASQAVTSNEKEGRMKNAVGISLMAILLLGLTMAVNPAAAARLLGTTG